MHFSLQRRLKEYFTFLFHIQKEMKVFDEKIPEFAPYNGLHWEPNGSRSK